MNAAADWALARARTRLQGMRPHWFLLLGGVWVATLVSLAAGVGMDQPVLAAVPLLAVLVLLAIVKLPLRYTLLALTFLALVLENPTERPAYGLWRSPLYIVGALLLANWNTTLPIRALRFSGIDLLAGLMFLLWVHHRVVGRREVENPTQTARPVVVLAVVALGTVVFLMGYGVATRGDFTNSLWQAQKLLYVPIIFALMSATFRGPEDNKMIGGLIIAAATVKALLAVYVRVAVIGPEPPYATSHSDSMLFATAFTIPMTRFLIVADRRSFRLCMLVMPALIAGMVANGRRLVWVEVFLAAVVTLLMTPWTPIKRAMVRAVMLIVPMVPLYMAVGWSSSSGIFKPVRMFRSIADSSSDRSTQTRDIENYNLIFTLRQNSFIPLGFGHEYIELVQADDISTAFAQYRYIPHNSVLGLWAFAGTLGYTGLTLVTGMGVFMAARAYRRTRDVDHQTAAIACIATTFIYLMHGYGDMGMSSWTGVFLIAPTLVVAGKLAVGTGAWPARQRKVVAVVPGGGGSR